MAASYKEKLQILHSLFKAGLIDVNHMLDRSGYCVELRPESNVVFQTSTLDNFGNQYVVLMDSSLRMCPICGRAYKPKSVDDNCCFKCKSL